MESIRQEFILSRYTEIMKQKKRYTNCYFSVHALRAKLENQEFFAYQLGTDFLVVEKQNDFNYLYYMCDSWEWLQKIGEIKKEFPYLVVSIVQKKETEMQKTFLESGYTVYKTYQRLRKIEKAGVSDWDEETDYCNPGDKGRLIDMMNGTFDVLSDHIPTDRELDAFLSGGNIICIREDHLVVGFIIFEDKGKTSYIRMVCIDSVCRGKGLADQLMNTYFQIHKDCTSFTLWYDVDNTPAYSLYSKWGYESENMYNLIVVL